MARRYRLTKWDREILYEIMPKIRQTSDWNPTEITEMYRLMREHGQSPEQILDVWTHGGSDTRWIYYLPHAKGKLS